MKAVQKKVLKGSTEGTVHSEGFMAEVGYESVWSSKTKYHRLGSLKNRNLFLTILEPGSPRSGCQQIWFLCEPPSVACAVAAFSLCPHMASPLCMHTSSVSSFYTDASYIG